MNFVSFNLIKWQALASGLSERADWKKWVEGGRSWDGIEGQLLVDHIPPNVRRRMSSLSKLAVQNALMLAEGKELDYIIFSSRHAELTRTVSLLKDILRGEDASPTGFSQSVHNTAASHFTIISKKPVPITSICSGANSLGAALTEAAVYLALHPRHKVLLVDFDEPLPEPYDQLLHVSHPGYALGLLLTSGDTVRVALEPVKREEAAALDLIVQLLRETGADGKFLANLTLSSG
jgi:hypothetical protein